MPEARKMYGLGCWIINNNDKIEYFRNGKAKVFVGCENFG